MSKPSRKGKDRSKIERERELDSVLSFNNFDYDYSNPRSTYLTLSIVLLPSILAIVIPVIPNSPSNTDVAVLVTDTLIVILITFSVKYVIEWPWNWLRKIRSTKENIFNNVNSKYLIYNKDKSKFQTQLNEKIILIRKLIRYEIIALGTGVLSHCLSSLVMLWTRNYIIVEESRKNIVFSNLNVSLFFIWGCFKIILVFLQKLKDASLSGEDEYNLINEWNLDLFYSVEPFEDSVKNGERAEDAPAKASIERKSTLEIKLDEMMELYKQFVKMNEDKQKSFSLKIHGSSTLKEPRKRQHLQPDEIQKKHNSIGHSLSTIFEDQELKHVQPKKPITLDYSLHGVPNESRFKQIVTREESIKDFLEISDISLDHLHELLQDFVSMIKDIRDEYSLSDILDQPVIIRKIFYHHIAPLMLKIDNSTFKVFQKTIIIKTIFFELFDKHMVGNFRSVFSYLYSLLEKYLGSCKKMVKFWIYVNFEIPLRIVIHIIALIFLIPRRALEFITYPFIKISKEEFKAREFNLQPADRNIQKATPRKLAQKLNLVSPQIYPHPLDHDI